MSDAWPLHDLVGVSDIARTLRVSPQAVTNWRMRYPETFPQPLRELQMGPLYSMTQIREWRKRYFGE